MSARTGQGDAGADSADTFWAARERIYNRFHRYISFSLRRWRGEGRNRFTGALDALHDTEEALWSLSGGLPNSEAAAKLAAYGFLQALYVQGDAVKEMEIALDLPKQAISQSDVEQIRDMRNRLVGHPARRDWGKRPSSGNLSMMRTGDGLRLEGGIYYDDGFETVAIDVLDYIRRMKVGLLPALEAIEKAMDLKEETFRAAERGKPLIGLLRCDFTYSLGKIASAARDPDRLSFALSELSMMTKHLDEVRLELAARDFLTEGPLWALDTASGAARLLGRLAADATEDRVEESEWDAVVAGLRSAIDDLHKHLQAWDDEIAQVVPQ